MTSHSSESVRSSAVIPEETHARIGALVAANDVPVAWVIPHTVPTFLQEHGYQAGRPRRLAAPRRKAVGDGPSASKSRVLWRAGA
jgi:hypothetical protein